LKPAARPGADLAAQTARGMIRLYQLTFSAIFGQRCRYLPTCSHYGDEAIARHGLWAGVWIGLARLCRCHPWGGAGYDPVPLELPAAAVWWRPWSYGLWRLPQE
jgi:putative membrane protein insertion efficiency factor